jgi:hypothetical protein
MYQSFKLAMSYSADFTGFMDGYPQADDSPKSWRSGRTCSLVMDTVPPNGQFCTHGKVQISSVQGRSCWPPVAADQVASGNEGWILNFISC